MNTMRLLPLSGIAFVALVVVAIAGIGGSTPGPDASAAELASFYGDNIVRQGLGTFVLAASVPFLVVFGIGMATTLAARSEGGLTIAGYVLVAGTTLLAGAVLLASVAHFALANGADEGISPVALQALNAIDGNTWMAFNPAFGVMMLGAAGVLLTARAFRWLGWVALLFGIAAFVPFADFFALLGSLLWIVVVSVLLSRQAVSAYWPQSRATAAATAP